MGRGQGGTGRRRLWGICPLPLLKATAPVRRAALSMRLSSGNGPLLLLPQEVVTAPTAVGPGCCIISFNFSTSIRTFINLLFIKLSPQVTPFEWDPD